MKMSKNLIGVIIFLLIGSSYNYADSFRRNYVSADAKWILHVDLDKFKQSSIGKLILDQVMKDKTKKRLDALQTVLGIDIRKDLKSVTAYGREAEKGAHKGVMIINGKFDKERIISLISLGDNFESEQYGEFELIKISRKGGFKKIPRKAYGKIRNSWMTIYDTNTLIFAKHKDKLTKAIDVLAGKIESLENTKTFKHLDELDKNAMFLALANLGEIKTINPKSALFKGTTAVSLAVREIKQNNTDNADLNLLMIIDGKSLKDAELIERSIDGFVAIYQMQISLPQLENYSDLFNALNVNRDGKEVSVNFNYPSQRLFEVVKKMIALKKSRNKNKRKIR